MERRLQLELLDTLPVSDPRALRSRRDLRRINAWMRNARHVAACLDDVARRVTPECIVDLGAGDGTFLQRWSRSLRTLTPGIEVILVDCHRASSENTLAELRARGFKPRVEQSDAMRWLNSASLPPRTWILANLFLHHFLEEDLRVTFSVAAKKASIFCACEPRRGWWPLAATRLLSLIGANAVTRHDAAVSVRAGFDGRELSALWPANGHWLVRERRAGLFSHVMFAERRDGGPGRRVVAP
jgi:hypothetical protein